MKPVFFNVLLLATAIVFLYSCEYQPSGENFREVAKPDTTKMIQVNLSPFETQYVFTKFANVNYNLNTFGQKIYNVEFFIDNQSIHQGTEAVGYFGFNPALYGRGTKTMTMVVTTSTNTGSLSDLIGSEALIYQRSWNLILDGEAPDPVEITKITNDNGVLNLEWEEYKRINFEKYIVYRKFGKTNESAETHEIAEFTDPKQLSVTDLSYIGGNSTYWIVVQGSDQSSIGTKKEISYELPRLDTAWVAGDSARFVWKKNPFYKALKKVSISTTGLTYGSKTEIFTSENPNDTSVVLKNLSFGKPLTYTLSNFSKVEIGLFDQKDQLKSDLSLSLGKSFPVSSKILCSQTENFVYVWNNNQISKLDMSNDKVVSSAGCANFYTWFFSDFDGNIYTNSPNLTRFNKNDLNDSKTFYPEDFEIHGFWTTASISSNNRIAGPIGLYVGYYDITEKRLVFTEKNTNIGWSIFSPDGNYAFNIQYLSYADRKILDIYKVTDTGLIKMGSIPGNNYSSMFWTPGKDHQIMTTAGSQTSTNPTDKVTVSVWDAANISKEFEFQANAGYQTNIDVFSRQIAFWKKNSNSISGNNFYIYNYETGQLVQELNVNSGVESVYLFRSRVLSSEGYSLNYSSN